MSRRFVTDLSDGESVEQVFLASEKQLRTNRSGNLYLQVRLSDKTGSLTAMMWNADQRHYESFKNGDYVRVAGAAQNYNGNMQLILKSLRSIEDASQVDPADFETVSSLKIDELTRELGTQLRQIANDSLRGLAECILVDEELMGQIRKAPAGVKNHHAYAGGLLEHMVSLIRLCSATAALYEELDGDLLVMGAFLHDIGKIEELTYSPDLGYSSAGQLLGHIVQGVQILDRKIRDCERQTGEAFPADLAMRLQHMVVSHHGEYEFGSPRLPMTYEALALHYLDNLDAKMANFRQLINEDANVDSPWTSFNPQLGRKILKA